MTVIRKLLAVAAMGLATGLAHAGNVNWSIGINLPPVGAVVSNSPYYGNGAYYSGVPYYAPPPVVYRPAPIYYAPAPVVVYRPVPIYAGPPAYVVDRRGPPHHRHWDRGHGRHHDHHDRRGWRRDRD